jgi:crossover junction endodeoxyribonuclease RuvC
MHHDPHDPQVIIAIDPGTIVTGYGIIKIESSSYHAVDYGCIRPPARLKLSERYLIIFESLEQLLETHKPHVLVVETQFVDKHKSVQSAIKLGMARGVAILAAKRRGLKVFEYAPLKAKKAIVGNGRASKQQVNWMVQKLLNLAAPPHPEDASDALSLALCHAHSNRHTALQASEI